LGKARRLQWLLLLLLLHHLLAHQQQLVELHLFLQLLLLLLPHLHGWTVQVSCATKSGTSAKA
jgi:hypothetical protein